MLNMKVSDYIIKSDDNNVTVTKLVRDDKKEIKIDKNGNEVTTLVGYYRDLERALSAIQKNYVYASEDEIKTIDEYRNKLNEVTQYFKDQIKL